MDPLVQPNVWVFFRLPSGSLKVQQVIPNSTISLGRFGSFSANHILSRPYNVTYELLDRLPSQLSSSLRIVPASELHADTIAEENAPALTSDTISAGDGVEFELLNSETGEVLVRSNRETIDDAAQQTLTMAEIEELKKEGTGAGMDLIKKLMASHLGIEQKTTFSLAKYKLLKTKKYLRRFTILPMDVPMLTTWMMEEKDAGKILEMREEALALVGSWANVHFSERLDSEPSGRWLVVDDTGGLLVAAMAERMGVLHPPSSSSKEAQADENEERYYDPPPATSNSLTLVHANAQPNLSLLKYFAYSPTSSLPEHTAPNHALCTYLSTLSWLQLLSPSLDTTFSTHIPVLSPEELASMKSNKRGTYYRKYRRYKRLTTIVSSTAAGNFDGLAIATQMDPISVLKPLLPLLRGGAPVAIYAPTVEPLTLLADVFSTSRRTAFIQALPASFLALSPPERETWPGDEDFPLNPTLLLNSTVQTARVRQWQVLPGRTHPVMTGRGGAEGYIFTAVRVRPAEGRVEARGKFGGKKRPAANAVNAAKEEGREGGGKKEKVDEGVQVDAAVHDPGAIAVRDASAEESNDMTQADAGGDIMALDKP